MNIVEAIRKLAADCPNCRYTSAEVMGPGDDHPRQRWLYSKGECSNGSCGCIVGQALAMLGHNVAELDKGNNCGNASHVLNRLGVGTQMERQWAHAVQAQQDHGETWGRAVAYADRCYSLTVAA